MAEAWRQAAKVAAEIGAPSASMAAWPMSRSSSRRSMACASHAAVRTLTAAVVTSGPTPSPQRTRTRALPVTGGSPGVASVVVLGTLARRAGVAQPQRRAPRRGPDRPEVGGEAGVQHVGERHEAVARSPPAQREPAKAAAY